MLLNPLVPGVRGVRPLLVVVGLVAHLRFLSVAALHYVPGEIEADAVRGRTEVLSRVPPEESQTLIGNFCVLILHLPSLRVLLSFSDVQQALAPGGVEREIICFFLGLRQQGFGEARDLRGQHGVLPS